MSMSRRCLRICIADMIIFAIMKPIDLVDVVPMTDVCVTCTETNLMLAGIENGEGIMSNFTFAGTDRMPLRDVVVARISAAGEKE